MSTRGEREARSLALRIAGELRARAQQTPRTYLFRMRDDKYLRAIDQTVSTGERVLLFEAYRGITPVYGQYAVVRADAPAGGAWFGPETTVRDEGRALSMMELAIGKQLASFDASRPAADEPVDVREGVSGAASYVPRFGPTDYARVLARVPLLLVLWSVIVAWLGFVAGMAWAVSAGTPGPAAPQPLLALLLPQMVAMIGLATAGYMGRSGHGLRTLALAFFAFLPVVLAPAFPVGPFLAAGGGALMAAAAASAAAVRVFVPMAGFAIVAFGAAVVSANLFASAPLAAAAVLGGGMTLATLVTTALIRWAQNRAAQHGTLS